MVLSFTINSSDTKDKSLWISLIVVSIFTFGGAVILLRCSGPRWRSIFQEKRMTHWPIGGKQDRHHHQQTTKFLGKFLQPMLQLSSERRPSYQNILRLRSGEHRVKEVGTMRSIISVPDPFTDHYFQQAGSKLCQCGRQKLFVRVSRGKMDSSSLL